MKITITAEQARGHVPPEGAVVEVDQLRANPARGAMAEKYTYEGNWYYDLDLEASQLVELLPFQHGVSRVLSRAGHGRTSFLRKWVDVAVEGWRDVVYINLDGDTSKKNSKVRTNPVLELTAYKHTSIKEILKTMPSGSVLVLDSVSSIQYSGFSGERFNTTVFLAGLNRTAKERGVMVVASIATERGAGVGKMIEIRLPYSEEVEVEAPSEPKEVSAPATTTPTPLETSNES
jgi:hypothetical protein